MEYVLNHLHEKGTGECGIRYAYFPSTNTKGWYVWYEDDKDTYETDLHDNQEDAIRDAENRWL